MSVNPGAEVFLGIVQMESKKVGEPDDLVEFCQSFFPTFLCPYVVAGGENVASVDADADWDFLVKIADDFSNLFEPVANARPLSRSHL